MKRALLFSSVLATALLASPSEFKATLKGHAILPHDSFIKAPSDAPKLLQTTGKFAGASRSDELGTIDGKSNGRPTGIKYPFDAQSVQGHSGIVNLGDGRFAIITDNGLGNKRNSKDNMLFYNIYKIDFESGKFDREKTVFLKDPNRVVPFLLVTEATDERYLTGGDFDPESIQFVGEYTYIDDEYLTCQCNYNFS